MPKRILICTELSPAEMRAAAFGAGTARERKRALAIAHVLDGLVALVGQTTCLGGRHASSSP